MKNVLLSLNVCAVFLLTLLLMKSVNAHCEIPCGIYEDEMRLNMISEHIITIEKSMWMIEEISMETIKNWNQLVRWINNKEEHTKKIQEIVYQYFMTQRVKMVDKKNVDDYERYVKQITLLHQMLVYAMKAKQTTDIVNTEKLKSLLDEFRIIYRGAEQK